MGLRETYGGLIEDALNNALDKNIDADAIKAFLYKEVDAFIESKLEAIKHKIKADVIDLIDGEDDIK